MSAPELFLDGRVALHAGDCLDVLRGMADASVDSVVTDPPYHLTSIVKRFGGALGRAGGRAADQGAGGGPVGRPLFPPGPGDIDGWRGVLARAPELEPAIRRMADGVAARLDGARVDRLRMLGNGVVPLAAGYALRTLRDAHTARAGLSTDRYVRRVSA